VVKRSPAHAARQREFLGWSAVSFRKLELTTYRLQPAYIGEFSSPRSGSTFDARERAELACRTAPGAALRNHRCPSFGLPVRSWHETCNSCKPIKA